MTEWEVKILKGFHLSSQRNQEKEYLRVGEYERNHGKKGAAKGHSQQSRNRRKGTQTDKDYLQNDL